MKRTIFKIVISLFLVLFTIQAKAQQNFTVTIKMPPPGTLNVSDFWNVTVTNNSGSDQSGYLAGTAKEDKDGMIAKGTTVPVMFKKGVNNIKIKDLPKTPDVEYLSSDPRYKESLVRQGKFPSGKYEICVKVISAGTNEELGSDCINQEVLETGLLTLISPDNGQAIDTKSSVTFIWSSGGKVPEKGYNFKICEVMKNQTPETAIKSNNGFFELKGIKSTSFAYPNSAKEFKNGKKYVWIVSNGNTVSEAWTFDMINNVSKDSINKAEFCGQMIGYEKRIREDSEFKEGIDRLEKLTGEYKNKIDNDGNEFFRTTLVIIPVVVHIVYKYPADNISDAQVQSQIDALNRDFRKLNTDASSIPAGFQPFSTDTFIEFRLAQRDPFCNTTGPYTGITRTQTSVNQFVYNQSGTTPQQRNPIKFSSTGGKDGWPSDRYLNIWVCKNPTAVGLPSGATLMGYGSWPSELNSRPSEDGVVMNNISFGTMGTATFPYTKGRVAAHEVGHWLNLRHIWGDDLTACNGSDNVDDTPNQAGYNVNCPTFPHISCSNGPNGDMFMNQMDYTSDACRTMFSAGQSDRMNATLYFIRYGLLGSQGAIPPGPVTSDLWMKDTDDEIGDEPNNISTMHWISDDIWIRNNNDGLTNQEHQNPDGDANIHVYVRVRNRGCAASSPATLKLYWAKASTGLSWPAPWDGSVLSPLMGNLVGTQNIVPIAGNDFAIYHFNWHTPKPSDYNNIIPDISHFCMIARIETTPTGSYGMTFAETTAFWENVKNNNNIVWKNIHINSLDGGFVSVSVTNYTKKNMECSLNFDFRSNEKNNINVKTDEILNEGDFEVKFDKELNELIMKNGDSNIVGLKFIEGTTYKITSLDARINKVFLVPDVIHYASIRFTANENAKKQRKLISLNLIQKDNNNNIIGGQNYKFVVKGRYNPDEIINDGDSRRNPINFWAIGVELTKVYNWSVLSSKNCAEYDQTETITYGYSNGWLWSSNDGMYNFSVAEQNALIADAKLWANNNRPNCSNGLKKSIVSITFFTDMMPSIPGHYFIGCHVKYGCCTKLLKPEYHN